MSELQDYLNTKKRPTYLLGPLERWWMSRTTPSDRRTDVLHPSEITKSDWCIRESWFLLEGEEKKRESISLRLARIFQTGHDAHSSWQSMLAEANWLRGLWSCSQHGQWWGLREDYCLECSVTYEEVPIVHDEYFIAGHADGWVTGVPGQEDALLEIKTIGMGTLRAGGESVAGGLDKSFSRLTRPLHTHVRQAMLYLYCLKYMYEKGVIQEDPPSQLVFIYELKSDQTPKEFVVQYHEDYLEDTLEKLEELRICREEGRVPECSKEKGSCSCERYS